MSLTGVLAFISFVIALLMHCFKWSSGVINVDFFVILGLAFLALSAIWSGPVIPVRGTKSSA